jgi:murein DD-endopeptidase MepM/ murein hydrolase activator NlpD
MDARLIGSPFPAIDTPVPAEDDPVFPHSAFVQCQFAKDYDVPVGTEVQAVCDGTVVSAKTDSHTYGYSAEFAEHANFICVDHHDGTFAEYIHLQADSQIIEVGDYVKRGQVLARTGLSGCMNEPHLHLNLFAVGREGARSVPFIIHRQAAKRD